MIDEPKAPEDQEEKNLYAFLDKFEKVYGNVLETIPDKFYSATFAEIIRGGLNTLRHCIENPEDSGVSWESPWVEAHYPVGWDWERGHILNFKIPEPLLESALKGEDLFKTRTDEVVKLAQDLTAAASSPAVLSQLTRQVVVRVKEGQEDEVLFLEPKMEKEWEALKTDEERDAYLDKVREPFSIGGLETFDKENGKGIIIHFDHLDIKKEDTPPPLGSETIKRLKDLPSLIFDVEDEGRELKGSVVIMIHPLVVDEDKREAYFPVVVGLVFAPPEIKEGEDPVINPAAWAGDEEKQKTFFKELWELLLEKMPRKLAGEEEAPEPSKLVPVGAPGPRRTIGVAFGQTLYSNKTMELLRTMNRIHLPKKWSNVKRWENLEREEVKAIHEEEGSRAFEDLKGKTGDRDARGPLLKKVFNSAGKEEIKLSPEGYRRLRLREGTGRGFIDHNPYGEEAFSRLYQGPGESYLEIGASWNGLAGPIFEGWRELQKKNTEADLKRLKESGSLFPGLNEDEIKKVEARLDRLKTWGHGHLMMDVIVGQVGIQKRNPVLIPAETFRVLLWPERSRTRKWPAHWKHEIESALSSLTKFTFTMKSYKMESLKGYGVLVADWKYHDLGTSGQGSRGDGEYKIIVNPGALGCLNIFESGKVSLRRGIEATSFSFRQTNEIKEALRKKREDPKDPDYYTMKDAGGVFYNTAAGLTPSKKNLYAFIDRNVTIKSDPARDKTARVGATAKDAKEPRLYTSAFCPLLEKDKSYQGALGHFKQSRYPESGFTLGGAENRKGRRAGGLLDQMGLTIPKGGKGKRKSAVIAEGLENLRAVAEEYLEGIVAGNDGTGWIPLKDFHSLGGKKLLKELHVFIFLPPEWRDRVRSKWENTTDRRVTEDPREAERDIIEGGDPGEIREAVANEADGFKGWPRHRRLHGMMKARGINQKKLAAIFGVSAPLVSNWMKGESSRGDRVHRVAIPERLWGLVDGWIETGREPSLEELEASKKKESPTPKE